MSEYRSLRFVHPRGQRVLGEEDAPLGLQLGGAGRIEIVEDLEAIRQDLAMLLTTRPGERVMRPDYGCDLHRLIFAPNDDTTAGLAIHYVRRAIERWEPRVDNLEVDAARSMEDGARLDIHISYRVRHSHRRDRWSVTLDLDSGVSDIDGDREGGHRIP